MRRLSCDATGSTMEISVRPAKKQELPALAKLFSEVLKRLPYYNALAKRYELRKYAPNELVQKQTKDRYSVLAALDESDRIVGFCFNHFDDFTIWIDWFGVDSSARQKGIGMTILKSTFDSARKRGAHKVWCDSRASNEPSKNLLRKAGFRDIAEIKDHWYGQDFILWERFV